MGKTLSFKKPQVMQNGDISCSDGKENSSYQLHVDKGRAHPTTEDPPGRGLRGVGCEDMCVFSRMEVLGNCDHQVQVCMYMCMCYVNLCGCVSYTDNGG